MEFQWNFDKFGRIFHGFWRKRKDSSEFGKILEGFSRNWKDFSRFFRILNQFFEKSGRILENFEGFFKESVEI